jgi:hypothetical protein
MKGPTFTVWSSDQDEEEQEPFRTRVQRKGVGIIEIISFDDHADLYCPMCKKAGFSVRLGPRILMPGQVREPDYDQWLECPDCREVVAACVVEHDATIIMDDIETVDSPFESTQSEIIGAVSKRTTKPGKRAITKHNKERYRQHSKDPEIDSLLRIYGSDYVNVIE